MTETPQIDQPMSSSSSAKNNTQLLTGVVVVAVIGILAFGAMAYEKRSAAQPSANITPAVSPTTATAGSATPTVTTPTAPASEYKDGTYTAEGEYRSPGGPEKVGVTVTLQDNVIQEVEFKSMAELPISKNMQAKFSEGYKPLVVGKNINDVKLSKVSGSSLTPQGFNDALEKIKSQAS